VAHALACDRSVWPYRGSQGLFSLALPSKSELFAAILYRPC